MKLSILFRNAWELFRHNRLIWLLAILYALASQLITLLPDNPQELGVYCGAACLTFRNAIEQELHPGNIKEDLKQVKVQRRRWRIGSLKKKGVWGSQGDPD